MEKLKFPKLRISFNTKYNNNPISVQVDGDTKVLPRGQYNFYHEIESINDVLHFQFTNFVPGDESQQVVVNVFHDEKVKDIYSLNSLIMEGNAYIENKTLTTNIIRFNGKFQIKFFKEWFECNILGGSQILDQKNMLPQYGLGYDNKKNLRVDLTDKDYDIVCLGCSVTYGYELPIEESWPHILQQKTNLKVANFGTPGAGIDTIFKQYSYVKKNINTKEIYILLPNFHRKRIKFYFGDILTEHLYTLSSPHSDFLGEKYREQLNKEMLYYSVARGKKIINFLQEQENVSLTSWDDEVYDALSQSARLPKYLYNEVTVKRTSDGVHPVKQHNEHFVNLLCKHRQNDNLVL